MLNVVIPIVSNVNGYNKLVSKLIGLEDVNVLIGITSSLKSHVEGLSGDNVYVIEFEDGSSREGIINGLHRYIGEGSIMILRKPISIDEFNNFVRSKKDIVLCQKKYSPIKKIFFLLWQKILKLFLGLKQYEGDTSAILFSEDVSAVLNDSVDLSFTSRVDRWRGLEQGFVQVQGEAVKADIDTKTIMKYFLIAITALLIGTIVTVCVCLFVNVSIIIGLLLVCLDIICVMVILIMIVLVIFNYSIGKKHFSSAIEIGNDDYDDSDYLIEEDVEDETEDGLEDDIEEGGEDE